MTITRVIRDDVEFFTINATGESGMSESGLARLCGIDRKSVSNFIRNVGRDQNQFFDAETSPSQSLRVRLKGLTSEERSYISHLSFISASICADVIEHYAFYARHKTNQALLVYQKFAKLGISNWIQQITDWHGNATLTSESLR